MTALELNALILENLTTSEMKERSKLIGKFMRGSATQIEKDRLNYLEKKARNLI